jgi:hypothetical protein
MGHQKQGSSIREPYLGRVEPRVDIEGGWFLHKGLQKQGSSIREPNLGRVEPRVDIEGWFLNMGH